MATVNYLVIPSEEQWISLSNDYNAEVLFDYIYKRWYYNLYNNDELVFAGIPLNKDCAPLKGISPVYLAVLEDLPNKIEYEPFSELGDILKLVEVVE